MNGIDGRRQGRRKEEQDGSTNYYRGCKIWCPRPINRRLSKGRKEGMTRTAFCCWPTWLTGWLTVGRWWWCSLMMDDPHFRLSGIPNGKCCLCNQIKVHRWRGNSRCANNDDDASMNEWSWQFWWWDSDGHCTSSKSTFFCWPEGANLLVWGLKCLPAKSKQKCQDQRDQLKIPDGDDRTQPGILLLLVQSAYTSDVTTSFFPLFGIVNIYVCVADSLHAISLLPSSQPCILLFFCFEFPQFSHIYFLHTTTQLSAKIQYEFFFPNLLFMCQFF